MDDAKSIEYDCLEAYATNKEFFNSEMGIIIQIADSRAELEKISGVSHDKWFVGSGCGNNFIVVLSEKIVVEEGVKENFSLKKLFGLV